MMEITPQVEFWLTFENIEPARKIFRAWKKKIAGIEDNWLAVSIITGVNADYPAHYRIVLEVKDDYIKTRKTGTGLMTVSPLILDVTPATSGSLDMFLQAFDKLGWYDFGAARASSTGLEPDLNLVIRKRELNVIAAWKIDAENTLFRALRGITNPAIPPDVSNPPINSALKKYNDSQARRN